MNSIFSLLIAAGRYRHYLSCLPVCLVLLLSLSSLSASIGGAEAEYSYDEFLIAELNLATYAPQAYRSPVQTRSLSVGQSYTINSYLTSYLQRSDSLWVISTEASYYDYLYRGSLNLSYRDNHTLIYDYFDYPHKESQNISSIKLNTGLEYDFHETDNKLLYKNSFIGHIDHGSNDTINPLTIGNTGRLDFQRERHLFSVGLDLPPFHNGNHYQIQTGYYNRRISIENDKIRSYLLGIGVTATKSEDNTDYFPSATFLYNRHNTQKISLRLEESFSKYPLHKHFFGKSLFWGSRKSDSESSRNPIAARKLTGAAELSSSIFIHRLQAEYRNSDRSFRFDKVSDSDGSSYTIVNVPEKHEALQLTYTLQHNTSSLSISYRELDQKELEPKLHIKGGTEFFIKIFHSLLFDISYYHDYQTLFDEGKVNFAEIQAAYRYANLKNITLELGLFYSTFEPSESYWDNHPSIFTQIRYGKF